MRSPNHRLFLQPNINTEARDPRGSLFTASVSSREVSAPVPRRPVARDFSSDPLPKRAKRSRVIASSSGLGGALVNRKKLQKDQSTGNIGIKRNKEEMSKNFEKLGLQPYEYEIFQRKVGTPLRRRQRPRVLPIHRFVAMTTRTSPAS